MDRNAKNQRPRQSHTTGNHRLLPDLTLVGHASADRRPAQERLEDMLGVDLTRKLIRLLLQHPASQFQGLERPLAA